MTFRMDPRAKLYLLLLANLMLLFHVGTGAEAAATALCLLLFFLSGKARAGVQLSVLYFGLLAVDLFVVPRRRGWRAVEPALPRLGRRADDAALHHHRRLCVFNDDSRGADRRAAPDAPAGEHHHPLCRRRAVLSHRGRGLPPHPRGHGPAGHCRRARGALLRHPVQSLEYILMPLLMNSNNVAQDLSAAALTKGIGLPGRHTCMTELRLTAWDFLYPALCTLPLLWKVVTLL